MFTVGFPEPDNIGQKAQTRRGVRRRSAGVQREGTRYR